jgi:hypothetical protein
MKIRESALAKVLGGVSSREIIFIRGIAREGGGRLGF